MQVQVIFTVPADGIYTFNVSYLPTADGWFKGSYQFMSILPFMKKLPLILAAGTTVTVRSVTIKLSKGNTVSLVIYTGTATQTGTGSFAGYKVN